MQVVPFLLTRLRAEHEAELQRRLAEMKSKHEQELEHTVTRDRSEAASSCHPSRAVCATCPASGTLDVVILMYMYCLTCRCRCTCTHWYKGTRERSANSYVWLSTDDALQHTGLYMLSGNL